MRIKAWTTPVALGVLLAGAASCSKLEKKAEQVKRKAAPATSIHRSGPVDRPSPPTRKYTIRYVSVREPMGKGELRGIRKRKPKKAFELLQKNPFLRLRIGKPPLCRPGENVGQGRNELF